MRRTKIVASLIASASLAMVGLGTTAASAATSGSTTANFTITGGALSVTVPANGVNLGTSGTGATSLSGQLGTVSVADARGALPAAWTTTVTSTTFVRNGGTATADETVATAAIGYASGTLTTTGGGLVPVFTGSGVVTPAAVGAGVTAASLTAGVGNNTASWNPTLTFTLLSTQVAGVYDGTITHSVA
jgi:hypothetical protein